MGRPTALDTQWLNLMSLCASEARLKAEGRDHPKVMKLVNADIEQLAREMGFSERQIKTREFRAERDGRRITRIVADQETR
jgi:hypothetical protein